MEDTLLRFRPSHSGLWKRNLSQLTLEKIWSKKPVIKRKPQPVNKTHPMPTVRLKIPKLNQVARSR
jgi:hypothetical protein